MRPTYHLVPADVWAATDPFEPYVAPSLATEGFIHCTDGVEAVIATANRHYRADPRPYVVLTVDLDRVGSPWRFDDPDGAYPHVYGPMHPHAVIGVQPVRRGLDGSFVALDDRSRTWTIREYRTGDGDRLRALWATAGFRIVGDDDRELEGFRARNPGLLSVAEVDGAIAGSAMGAWDGRRGWIYHVTAAPAYRRLGLASELVQRVEDGLRAVGCQRALVLVEVANDDALAFWAARGYDVRDTRQLAKTL